MQPDGCFFFGIDPKDPAEEEEEAEELEIEDATQEDGVLNPTDDFVAATLAAAAASL